MIKRVQNETKILTITAWEYWQTIGHFIKAILLVFKCPTRLHRILDEVRCEHMTALPKDRPLATQMWPGKWSSDTRML